MFRYIKLGVVLLFIAAFAINLASQNSEGTTYSFDSIPVDLPEIVYETDMERTIRLAPFNREVECLAKNIYHEARGEPTSGRYAVAWVTMNRVHSDEFPNTTCGVVYQISHSSDRSKRWAEFSWTLENPAAPSGRGWEDAKRIARTVYARDAAGVPNPWNDPNVMFYHADYVSDAGTAWFRNSLAERNQIGRHIFYSLPA